jgi:hypothetical protein
MEPQRLDYATPSPATFDWPFFIRLFFIGPFTGMCVGCAQTAAAVLCWVRHGEADFYFRGWSGVQLHFFALTVGGAFVGFAYGVVLMVLESRIARRVHLWTAIPIVVAFSFAAAAVIAELELRRRETGPLFLPQLIAVGFGLLISAATARRVPRSPAVED